MDLLIFKLQYEELTSNNLIRISHGFKLLCNHKVKVKVKSLSHVQLFATPWTVAHQALLFMGFSRQ